MPPLAHQSCAEVVPESDRARINKPNSNTGKRRFMGRRPKFVLLLAGVALTYPLAFQLAVQGESAAIWFSEGEKMELTPREGALLCMDVVP